MTLISAFGHIGKDAPPTIIKILFREYDCDIWKQGLLGFWEYMFRILVTVLVLVLGISTVSFSSMYHYHNGYWSEECSLSFIGHHKKYTQWEQRES
jgi:hypothetical protein